MKTMQKVSLMLIITLVLSLLGIEQTEARGFNNKNSGNQRAESQHSRFQNMEHGMLNKLAQELKLTNEQEQEIAAIMAKHRVAGQNKREAFQKGQSDLRQKLLTAEFDEAALRAEYQKMDSERQKQKEDGFIERAKMLSEIKTVLTEEQLELFQEKSADWFQYRHASRQEGDWRNDQNNRGSRDGSRGKK